MRCVCFLNFLIPRPPKEFISMELKAKSNLKILFVYCLNVIKSKSTLKIYFDYFTVLLCIQIWPRALVEDKNNFYNYSDFINHIKKEKDLLSSVYAKKLYPNFIQNKYFNQPLKSKFLTFKLIQNKRTLTQPLYTVNGH